MQIRENEIARDIVDACYHIHVELGPGLLESVYEVVLARELENRGRRVQRQVAVPIRFRGLTFEEGFRADMIIDELVLVEIKSVSKVLSVHEKQVLTYLRLTELRLGLLVNFGSALMKDGITRVANGMPS